MWSLHFYMSAIRRRSSEYSMSFDASLSENKIEIDDVNKKTAQKHLYKMLFRDWIALVGIIPAALLGALPCLCIYLSIDMVNALIYWMAAAMAPQRYDPMDQVTSVLWKMAIVGACMGIVKFFEQLCWVNVGSRLSERLRTNLFTNMMRSEVAFFDVNPIGSVLTLLSEDAESVQIAFGQVKSAQITSIVQGIVGIIWAFCTAWDITLISLASVPVICIALVFIIPPVLKHAAIKFTHTSKSMTICEETLSAIRTVRGFNHEEIETKRFDKQTKAAGKHEKIIGNYIAVLLAVVLAAVIGDMLGNMYYGTWRVTKGKIEFGDMFAAMGYTGIGSMGIIALEGTMQGEQKAIDSGARIMKLSEHIPSIPFEGGETIEDFKGHIEFINVSFKYPTRDCYVLKNVSFEIKPGQIGALVGHSGSGKSTCVQLIERYYDITEGIILIDSHDIKTLDPRWLHTKIALVSQEPVLFRMSLRDNITYGRKDATNDEIMNAIEVANATKILDKLENGLDTMVGEKGSSLSGGQRQRIAIARAVIKNPVILVTDEATSALDAGSEKKVQIALDRIMKNCTSVIVAHRLSTIRHASVIYVFDAGEIKEVGTHEELVERGGYYYNLVSRQLTNEDEKRKEEHDMKEKHEVKSIETDDVSKSSSDKVDKVKVDEYSDSSSSSSSDSSNSTSN